MFVHIFPRNKLFFDFRYNRGHNIFGIRRQNGKKRKKSLHTMCRNFAIFDDMRKSLNIGILLHRTLNIRVLWHVSGQRIFRSKELKAQGSYLKVNLKFLPLEVRKTLIHSLWSSTLLHNYSKHLNYYVHVCVKKLKSIFCLFGDIYLPIWL